MAEAPFDIQKAHRWFAVEFNNMAWDLLEAENRSEDETEQIIHAVCLHWMQVGTPLNHQRAQCLLTTVYARLGYADAAVRHSTKCLALSQQTGEEQSSFDRATTYGCAALAYQCAGQLDKAEELRQQALQAASTFDDLDDREVFEKLYLRS